METMNYYTHSKVTLGDIDRLAQQANYRTFVRKWKDDDELIVLFGDDPHMRWEWSEYTRETICLEEEPRERLNKLDPTCILLFEYGQRWLPEIVQFMTIVLKEYGGWVDCLGDVDVMYTLDNIEGLISGCP